MKTYNNIWKDIIDWGSLYWAYLAARAGKRYAGEVLEFQERLEEKLTVIQNQLIWGQWRPGRWHEFIVHDPKLRLIQAPPFADRIVHHALVDAISPFFEKKFIHDSYACRVGKGFHMATKRTQCFLRCVSKRPGGPYVLKADISKYFPSINHDCLMSILRRTIRDVPVLQLCEVIVRQSGFPEVGIPVGALTSQLFANTYLDQLDHYLKDQLGVKYYCRYMDDFIVVHNSKKELWEILKAAEDFLINRLCLRLNPKTDIFPGSHGVDFCGYRIWASHILPRRRTVRRARHKLQRLARLCSAGQIPLLRVRASIMSFIGYMQHCSGHRTTLEILQQTIIQRRKKCV